MPDFQFTGEQDMSVRKAKEYFAWIKTVDDAAKAPLLPGCSCDCDGGMKCCCAPKEKSGDRPPGTATGSRLLPDGSRVDGEGNTLEVCCDANHVVLKASPDAYGEWRVDSTYQGQGGESFEILYFLGGRQDAITWLHGAEGQEWRSNALNVSLIKFASPTKARLSDDDCCDDDDELEDGYGSAFSWPDNLKFPMKSWRCDYRQIGAGSIIDDTDLWLRTRMEALVEQAVVDLRDVASSISFVDEADLMTQRTANVSADVLARIRKQASNAAALKAVLDLDTELLNMPSTMALVDRVRTELRYPIFRLKWLFARSRPWELTPAWPLVIKSGEPLFPAHAAYPAGHAVLAYTLARLMKEVDDESDFATRATGVSLNRVVAGLHWPCDLVAGKKVADIFGEALFAEPAMKQLLRDVAEEWRLRPVQS